MRGHAAVRCGKIMLWALCILSLVSLYSFASSWSSSTDVEVPPESDSSFPPLPPLPLDQEDLQAGLAWTGNGQGHNKTLVVYVYFEKNQLYKDNLQFFLELGVHERDDVDYIFVLQGSCSVKFPQWRNVKVYSKKNDCLDFGGWRYGLDRIGWRERGYRYFVFLNSSVRGPFLPLYVPRTIYWTTLFTQFLRESGDGYAENGPIKLVGITINCFMHRPHVQSMLWVTDFEALTYLIDNTEVVTCKKTMKEAIDYGEIALSMKLLAHGWNIASLSLATRGWDFRVQRSCNSNTDPNYKTGYYGIAPGVHETIFVKANRNVRTQEVDVYSRFALQQVRRGKFDGLRFR